MIAKKTINPKKVEQVIFTDENGNEYRSKLSFMAALKKKGHNISHKYLCAKMEYKIRGKFTYFGVKYTFQPFQKLTKAATLPDEEHEPRLVAKTYTKELNGFRLTYSQYNDKLIHTAVI